MDTGFHTLPGAVPEFYAEGQLWAELCLPQLMFWSPGPYFRDGLCGGRVFAGGIRGPNLTHVVARRGAGPRPGWGGRGREGAQAAGGRRHTKEGGGGPHPADTRIPGSGL